MGGGKVVAVGCKKRVNIAKKGVVTTPGTPKTKPSNNRANSLFTTWSACKLFVYC
jgi:hypothetical protein